MIGGIGHDVQKIRVRLEELQRDVSQPPTTLTPTHLGREKFPRRYRLPVTNLYWGFRTTSAASD